MKKLYTGKVTQYDIQGNIVKIHDKVNDALSICNYDSIISCCKNKYKTAAGFVWRFENDPFNLTPPTKAPVATQKCGICGSSESVRSMAMHLKWVHQIKTDDYVTQYGEFRPKNLANAVKQEESKFECKICNIKVNSNQHLMYHITKEHPDMTKHDYIIEHVLDNVVPLCKCGCGEPVTILENGNNCDSGKETYSRDYIKGHWDWEVFTNIGKISKEEAELVEYVKEIYDGEIQTSVRGIIDKRELDIYLPDLSMAIEYNGLYWHSEKGNRFKDYHIDKTNKCNTKNIRLIQIFSDEWLNKKDITKSKLKSIISKDKQKGIPARKCVVKTIDATEKNKFLNTYHIQGEDRSQIKLGLYNKDMLVAVMTFSNPRMSLGGDHKQHETFELSRYASSSYIIGGAQKMLKHFIKNYNPKHIYSYADKRWSDPVNNMYNKLGFTTKGTSSPNYFYTKNFLVRLHRFNFNKFKLKAMGCDMSKTEKEIMENLGYTRIWDCGVIKFVMDV